MDAPATAELERFAAMVHAARSALFVTGAGISADSGLPTYRGVGGLYERAETDEGMPIEVALSGPMMEMEPAVPWKYIHEIESACRGAQPNPAHEVIARLEDVIERVWVLTQNVDGFHRGAGSSQIIEIHGNIGELECTRCGARRTVGDYEGLPIPPTCADCGGIERPRVVLFGEMLPAPALEALERELIQGFDLVVSVGTSSAFPYIAQPVILAKRGGASTVEVNPGESEVSGLVDLHIRARAKPTFEALWRILSA